MPNDVYIIYGKIKTGKSTRLLEQTKNNENACGILQIVKNETRRFLKLPEKIEFEMNADPREKNDVIALGDFAFSRKAFAKANAFLHECIKKEPKLLLFDEYGKLEINGEGLFPAMEEALQLKTKGELRSEIVFVVRDYLFDELVKTLRRFNLDYRVISDITEIAY
jgi:hypothetical protein